MREECQDLDSHYERYNFFQVRPRHCSFLTSRGDNTFYKVSNTGKSIVNKPQTPPKEHVIPEADEGGYQESLISFTVHSYKLLVNSSVRDPCFRRDDPSSGKSIVNNQ